MSTGSLLNLKSRQTSFHIFTLPDEFFLYLGARQVRERGGGNLGSFLYVMFVRNKAEAYTYKGLANPLAQVARIIL